MEKYVVKTNNNIFILKLSFLLFIMLISLTLLYYQISYAFFNDTASTTNNTFSSAEVFPPLTSPVNHIVISEIQIRGTGTNAASKDFIELYNPTSSPINLQGLRLFRRTQAGTTDNNVEVWNTSTTVKPFGYYLWASSANGYAASISADESSGNNIGTDDSIAIKVSSTGATLDAVAWGSGHAAPYVETSAFSTNPGSGESIERKAYIWSNASSMSSGGFDQFNGNGHDTDNNANDFFLRLNSQPQKSSDLIEVP